MPINDVSTSSPNDDGPGGKRVGPAGVVFSMAAVFLFATLNVYALMKLWPHTGEDPNKAPLAAQQAVTQAGTPADNPSRAANAAPAVLRDVAKPDSTKRISGKAALDRNGYLSCAPNDSTNVGLPIATADTAIGADCIVLFGADMPVWIEQRLLMIVLLAGALGASVHALRSIAWYVGNRELVYSWLAYYLSLPLAGSLMAAAFYMIVRGGFFSGTSVQATNTFGFAALGVLIGMFTNPAALKLKEVAETVLTKPQGGANSTPQLSGTAAAGSAATATGVPAIKRVERQRKSAGAARDALLVSGSGFSSAATVQVNGASRPADVQSAEAVLIPLTEEDMKIIDAGGDFVIVVSNPGAGASQPYDFA